MGFEKVTLLKVEKILGESRKACFFNGTMFVECDEVKARSIFHALTREHGLGKVQINYAAGEYIYDFVA
jgi:hypothetical protein